MHLRINKFYRYSLRSATHYFSFKKLTIFKIKTSAYLAYMPVDVDKKQNNLLVMC